MKKVYKGILMYLDGVENSVGDIISPSCVVEFGRHKDTIPVFRRDKLIGNAKLNEKTGKLFYEIEIHENYPDLESFIPAADGTVLKKSGNAITQVRINSVGLYHTNSDSRIKPIGKCEGGMEKCDCGGKIAKTTHAFWCETRKGEISG